jgi:hypothetical protein
VQWLRTLLAKQKKAQIRTLKRLYSKCRTEVKASSVVSVTLDSSTINESVSGCSDIATILRNLFGGVSLLETNGPKGCQKSPIPLVTHYLEFQIRNSEQTGKNVMMP